MSVRGEVTLPSCPETSHQGAPFTTPQEAGGPMAERLGNLAINQKVASLIPGRAK